MSDSPNQDEIDDPSESDGDNEQGEEATEAGPPSTEPSDHVEVYDFRRPARISKDRKRSLEAIYALFVKSLEAWLAGRTRAPIHITLSGLEQLTFGEFRMSLTSPCAAYSLDVSQGHGQNAVIGMGTSLTYYLLDRFLGGPGRALGAEERALTVMERQVMRIVAAKAASQLSEVWNEYAELDLAVVGFESIPDMLRAASREDPYLIANLDIVAGDMEGNMIIAIPFAGLDGFFAADTKRRNAMAQETMIQVADRKAAEGTVRTTGIGVHVRLPTFGVSLERIANLAPGDLIQTPHRGNTPVEILIGEQTRYLGRAGRSGSMLAAEISAVFEEDPKKDRKLR